MGAAIRTGAVNPRQTSAGSARCLFRRGVRCMSESTRLSAETWERLRFSCGCRWHPAASIGTPSQARSDSRYRRLTTATKSLRACSVDSLAPPPEIKPASSLRLRRRSREAGQFTRAVQLPLRFKPVDLGAPDWATSRQPEIVCELFDRPDITSFLRAWVFVTQIRVIVHLASCMEFGPRSEKVTQPRFPQIGRQRLQRQCRKLLQASHCLQPRSAAFL